MKALLLLSLLATSARSEELAIADLAKLNDPEKVLAEVTRLAIGEDREDYALTGYHLLKAQQADGKPPIHILCGERKYLSTYKSENEYEIENPSEIFGKKQQKVFAQLQPSLDLIKDSALFVFDDKGKEIRPFGGNNYIDGGYLFDFDGDGILDRAGSTNYGLDEAPKHNVQQFELHTVEPEPRELLNVIFNWHPNSADDTNDWTYHCTDVDGDGRPEIRFGPEDPADGEKSDTFVFKWDSASGKFTTGEIPEGSHIRIMKNGETLKSIAAAGGLGYPLIGKPDSENPIAVTKSRQEPYEFISLAGLPDKEFIAFFKGKSRRSFFDGAKGSFPNTVPENLFAMEPKEAALALAEVNRTAEHRKNFQLAIDDRNGATPPTSGWAQYSWISSGCYSLSTELYAIRFGMPDPVLVTFGYNSIGVVGRNRWADQPADNARIVKLSEKEATFLSGTLFWLDRIRSKDLSRDSDSRMSGSHSTADGHATVSLFPTDGESTELTSETAWATTSLSGNWIGEYNREVFANLAGLLIRAGVPKMLGDRW